VDSFGLLRTTSDRFGFWTSGAAVIRSNPKRAKVVAEVIRTGTGSAKGEVGGAKGEVRRARSAQTRERTGDPFVVKIAQDYSRLLKIGPDFWLIDLE
jgi:hypothetical protein